MKPILLASFLSLTACQAGSMVARNQELLFGRTQVRVDPATPTRLTVTMLNAADIGYSLERRADREAQVAAMLRRQCGAPRIVEERATEVGDVLIGAPFRFYTLTVECPNGAFTTPAS